MAELAIPEKAEREFIRADEFLLRQDIKGAIEHLKKAVEIAPQYSIAWNKLGTIAYQTHQYRQAEEYFRKSLQTDPEAYSPLVNLGGTLLSLQLYEDSLQYNQAAVKAMPADALAHSQLGQSYFYLARLDDAEMHPKRAKALDPGHFSFPQLFLAEIYFRNNQLKAVIAELEELLKLHPDSDWAPRIREMLKFAQARLTTPP